MPPSADSPEAAPTPAEPGLDITSPGVPIEPPAGLSDRELADWYREQVGLRDQDLAVLKAIIVDREAEGGRLARELERLAADRSRAEAAEAQIDDIERIKAEISQVVVYRVDNLLARASVRP